MGFGLLRVFFALSFLFNVSSSWAFEEPLNDAPDFSQLGGESSLPPAKQIRSQGSTPYCGLYAMSTFLEIWGNAEHPENDALPTQETAFVAFAYNQVVGTGLAGTHYSWLAYAVQKYGTVPEASVQYPDLSPFPTDWASMHESVIDKRWVESALTARYKHESMADAFAPKDYLAGNIHVDLRDFTLHYAESGETFRKTEDHTHYDYRIDDEKAREQAIGDEIKEAGMADSWTKESVDRLYALAKAQLYANRPVYVSINSGIVPYLGSSAVIGNDDLAPSGTTTRGSHAVVAVAHCDSTKSKNEICGRFNSDMRRKNVSECIAFQNSWGESSNANGYFCISKLALRRVLYTSAIWKDVASTVPEAK